MKLIGISQFGKNRIRELGEEWNLIQEKCEVKFSNELGPWLLIFPIKNPTKVRWIHKNEDRDFRIIFS